MTLPGRILRILALCAALLAPAGGLRAQESATLVSDRIEVTGDSRLIASGKVEVLYKGTRLSASRITYDRATERLEIEGPITLVEAGGDSVILASAADLRSDLSEGILTSARLVLNQQLQMAASRLARVEGRYTAMDRVVASSCRVCAASPTPLWEIRATRVVHDEVARQIYFDHAQFRISGVPVFYIPRLRMPDPTLDRAQGFLPARLRTTSDLGTGLKIPYFIPLGASRDLTLAPYLTTTGATTLEMRYRQAFRTGTIEFNGAISRDNLTDDSLRGYLFGRGAFDLPDDYRLTFGIQAASDNAYLLDYGYSDLDRLDSRAEISRVRRNGFLSARLVAFQSLRDEDDNDTLPSLVADVTFHRRFSLGPLGGEGGLRIQTHNHYRTSDDPLDGPDPDTIADGRDMGRVSARIDWRRSLILPGGIEATALGEAQLDAYSIRQDAIYGGNYGRGHAAAGIELRWPWVRAGGGSGGATTGATHVIEPVAQLIWANRHGDAIPDEDSTLVEFDEGNLFSLGRFPGADAVEEGYRANLGVTWTRFDPEGWNLGLTLGRVMRARDEGQFGPASGLGGRSSDWLAAVNLDWESGVQTTGRVLFDNDFEITKAELRFDFVDEIFSLSGSALWVIADPAENRPDPTRELRLDTGWQVTPAMKAKFRGSYDFESHRGTLAGMGVEFRNDCVSVDLSLSRRFTSSTSVSPTTDFGLSVDLIGFGSSKAAGPTGRCF
ncbi:LPS assembly protein LptD [Rhodobacteraceae bacterium PA1-206B]